MKKIFLLFIVFIFQKTYAQNVELHGTVTFYNMPTTGKIYFAEAGKKFNGKDFVQYDKNKKYKFSMSIAKIKNEKISYLIFGADTTQKTNDEQACIQKINVNEIINDSTLSKLKNIRLRNDFILNRNCTASPYYGAEKEEKIFLGRYRLQSKDTIRSITLHDYFNVYNSFLSKLTVNHTNEEFGYWNYDIKKQVLIFNKWHDLNSTFGILVINPLKFSFNVVNKNGEILFKNKTTLLKKL